VCYVNIQAENFENAGDDPSPSHTMTLTSAYLADESALVESLVLLAQQTEGANSAIEQRAAGWVNTIRGNADRSTVIDAFLQEYGLSTNEGLILMRLSEALIRTPDFATAQELMRDKLGDGRWFEHAGSSPATLINTATAGLRFSAAWIEATGGVAAANLLAKIGDRVLHAAVVRGMGIMAEHFVLGSTIEMAIARGKKDTQGGTLHSFDMLGEAACTQEDADRYMRSYTHAAAQLVRSNTHAATVADASGLSVKLSALHPRYEYANRTQCVPVLVDKVRALAVIAKSGGIGLTLDAEEADRLEVSLEIFEQLLHDPELADWDGLGIVVQAYQRRATVVIQQLTTMARSAGRKIAIRLVKGAYWDMEIKRAQELGLESYPVFTRKEHTDISYLACASLLLKATDCVFPQFATHNAHTASAIINMANGNTKLELQRLHGMGAPLHAEITKESGIRSRVYAPVGGHKELLPYLVRRLLENGANSSFVNQLMNPEVAIDEIVGNPLTLAIAQNYSANPSIPRPRDLFSGRRQSALGMDLTQASTSSFIETLVPLAQLQQCGSIIDGVTQGEAQQQVVRNPANPERSVGYAQWASSADVETAIDAAQKSNWAAQTTPQIRSDILMRTADLLEKNMPSLMALCVEEAGKSFPDAVAEIREAVDFCRYYALECTSPVIASRSALGIVACISPWNFPLAIFLGQITAALSAGNVVIAKPAQQTPLIAFEAVRLLHEAGVTKDALQLIIGGPDIGAQLISSAHVNGVCFTGSTATAKRIAASRANAGCADTPLIAETGGINVLIVDSTALLEQAVNDAIASAFQSAGQRCSACRIVCIQEEVADDFERMLAGAMQLLSVGNPALLTTDVGPIIDDDAKRRISDYVEAMRPKYRFIAEAPIDPKLTGHFIAPVAIAVNALSDVKDEIFGPVLHVVRFPANDVMALVDQINALGYGLTMGLHTRIDDRIEQIAAKAKVGNLYVNRNQIGAVVGVQPFGGEGLSGTGPKAGGPHYLLRLSRPSSDVPQSTARDASLQAFKIAPSQPGDIKDLSVAIAAAKKAQAIWAKAERHQFAQTAKSLLQNSEHNAFMHFAYIAARAQKIALPGPTGEENSLSLIPRGVIGAGGDDPKNLLRQVIQIIASGSAAIVAASEIESLAPLSEVHDVIRNSGLPSDILQIVSSDARWALLSAAIDGFIADGLSREPIAKILGERSGAIIPLLSAHDYPERYFHERTLTINTTAAGGNASLLLS
jgi:RHH-type transcriptional regulator, proline utilization regulon repressor / proline dehydrogenase / delta 1-pyrroline-5-carboxylate dehydrogenase